MAQKYTLVPTGWTHQAHQPQQNIESSPAIITEENTLPRESDQRREKGSSEMIKMVELFPKNIRNKAKLLLQFVEPRIKTDSDDRVIYDDGQIGSHLLDLIRFFVLPTTMNVSRPIDASKFGIWLKIKGVPNSAVGRDLILNSEEKSMIRGKGKNNSTDFILNSKEEKSKLDERSDHDLLYETVKHKRARIRRENHSSSKASLLQPLGRRRKNSTKYGFKKDARILHWTSL